MNKISAEEEWKAKKQMYAQKYQEKILLQ